METTTRSVLTPAQREAVGYLQRSERVLLVGHMKPDGDCIGAQAALAGVLARLGKWVEIWNPDAPEAQFDYLTSIQPYHRYEGGALPAHDLAVLLDCSELSRCGDLGLALQSAASRKLVIDHHIHDDVPWWDASFRDYKCAATGLLVWRIARELGIPGDEAIARGVFTSLVTDTGWFKYSNADEECFAVAAELMRAGVQPSEIYRAIYQRQRPEHPRLVGEALGTLEYHAGGRLAILDLPLDPNGRPPELDGDDLLDLARAVEQVEVVLLVRAVGKQKVKVSMRSKASYDVNRLARRFGGGGHAKASGATIEGDPTESRARVLQAAIEGFDEGRSGAGKR